MELLVACQMVFGLLQNQKLTVDEHQQVEKAFVVVAPKCVEEFKKKKEK